MKSLLAALILLAGGQAFAAEISNPNPTTVTINSTQLKGTTTNSSASAGFVGEYVSSGSINSNLTDQQWKDCAAITLTAGDWDISGGSTFIRNGATFTSTDLEIGISQTSGNSASGLVAAENLTAASASVPVTFLTTSFSIPSYRLSIASSGSAYLKVYADTISAGTAKMSCHIRARRVQ